MTHGFESLTLAAGLGLLAWTAPTPAQAGIDACGDIHVEPNAQCHRRGQAFLFALLVSAGVTLLGRRRL